MSMKQKFQVDLRGIIDLLSDHLYSGPQVYIRELMQNSVDAITARQKKDPAFDQPEIHLQVIEPEKTDSVPTLVVTDNGIGLTQDEVHQFLATIGNSSKRDLSREDFIGQFGIGLLSGFVVCEEIVVITRSVQPESPAVEWKGHSDGTYSVRVLEQSVSCGTQVFLRAKSGCHEYLTFDYVDRMARHFGDHLPISIRVSGRTDDNIINQTPPWNISDADSEDLRIRQLEYGLNSFGEKFLDAIPLKSQAGGVEGLAFVLPQTSRLQAKRGHRVYLKNMLLSERLDNLLPEWAFFVKCVVNTSRLRPTADREGFYENDALETTQAELGLCLRQYLVDLAETDRDRLDRIIALHHLPIKALAADDNEFFELFVDWLPFETSLGEMPLGEYRRQQPVVRYVRSKDQFRQIAGVASAQGMCIINAAYTYDADLMEKLAFLFPEQEVELVDASELAQDFDDLTIEEHDSLSRFIDSANDILEPFGCKVDIRRFQPQNLPALYTVSESAEFMRSVEQAKEDADDLWSGVLGHIADTSNDDSLAQLCLNFSNPLIGRLAQISDQTLLQRSVEMLYVQALLLGHYPLKAREMTLLNDGLLSLIEIGMNADDIQTDGE